MAEGKVIGRVSIKVIPEVENRRAEMRRKLKQQVDDAAKGIEKRKPIQIPAEIDGDAVDKSVDDAEKAIGKRKPKLRVGADYDDVLKAIGVIEEKIKDLGREEIELGVNEDELNQQLADMRKRLREDPVELSVSDDVDGAKEVLKKIESIRKEASKKKITFQTDEASLDAMEKQLKEKFGAALNDGMKEATSKGLELSVNEKSQESVKEALRQIDRELTRLGEESITVDLDEESLVATKNRLQHFVKEESGKNISFNPALVGTSIVAARLAFLTRPRVVPIFARVSGKSLAIAEGVLRSLAGLNVLQSVGSGVENIIRSFDKFAIKGISWITLIGNLTNVLGSLTTSLVSIGGGISQVIGLTALIPTLTASTAAIFTVLSMGFNNFLQSFHDIPIVAETALKKLPPAAREARDAMAGLWTEIRDPVQNLFWERLGTSVQDFANRVVPQIGRGLLLITPAVADFTKEILESFEEIAENGQMEQMFRNLGVALGNASKGAKPFFDAINILGLRGSEFLPMLGTWLHDAADQFHNFIVEADKAGDIDRWIIEGTEALKDIGGVIHAVTRQFSALTEIIDNAGGQSLDGFRINMERWAHVMESEPFKSRLENILRGTRAGATELNQGFKDLVETIGEASEATEILLTRLGSIGGEVLSRISDAFSEPVFQIGVLKGVLEIEDAIKSLGPTAENMGRIIGRVFDTGGTVIQNLVPLLENASRILDNMLRVAAPGLEALSGPLSRLLTNVLVLAEGPLMLIAEGIGAIGSAVAGAPESIQRLVTAFGAFLLLRGRIGGMLSSISTFWNKQRTVMRKGVADTASYSERFQRAVGIIPTAVTDTATKTERGAGRLRSAVGRVGRAASGVATAIGGIMSLGGGLVGGLAIAGIFTAIATGIQAVGEKARQHRDRIEEIKTTLDDFGKITDETSRLVAEDLTSLEKSITWKGNQVTVIDFLEEQGIKGDEVIQALTGTTEQYESLIERINKATSGARKEALGPNSGGSQQGILGGLGINANQLGQIEEAENRVSEWEKALAQARKEVEEVQRVTGGSFAGAANFKQAIDTLGDSASTTDEKLRAMVDIMDQMTKGKQSRNEAARSFGEAVVQMGDVIAAEVKKAKPIKWDDLVDKDGQFNFDPQSVNFEFSSSLSSEWTKDLNSALNLAMQDVEMLPPEQKVGAFKRSFEESLGNIRTEVKIEGGPEALAAFDRFFKGNGYDKLELLAELDPTGMSQAEFRAAVLELVNGTSEQSKVKPTLDTSLFLAEMPGFQTILQELGATKVTPTIDANGEPLTQKQQDAITKLRTIAETTTIAEIDANGSPLTTKQQQALRQLLEIDTFEAVPTIGANGAPLDEKARIAIAKLLGIDTTKAEAELDANSKPFDGEVKGAELLGKDFARNSFDPKLDAKPGQFNGKIKGANLIGQDFARNSYVPKLDATDNASDKISGVKSKGTDLDNDNYTPEVNVGINGAGALSNLINALASLPISKTISIGVNLIGAAADFLNADGSLSGSRYKPTAVHRFFANGGLSSKPTAAHIARPGSYVTYAERETGGEAFIPLAASKRARSLEIWKETGKRLNAFEDGAVNARVGGGEETLNINLNTRTSASAQEIADALNFELRHQRRGGKYRKG